MNEWHPSTKNRLAIGCQKKINAWIHVLQANTADSIPADPVEQKAKAQEVSASRILTQDDFKQIQQHQVAKEVDLKPNNKRKHVQIEENNERSF